MPKYRKKPVEVEAIQFKVTREVECKNGIHKDYNSMEICKFRGLPCMNTHYDSEGPYIEIDTLEGVMTARPGDYIIKGVKGEFYPYKPDIFEMTYEEVDDAE